MLRGVVQLERHVPRLYQLEHVPKQGGVHLEAALVEAVRHYRQGVLLSREGKAQQGKRVTTTKTVYDATSHKMTRTHRPRKMTTVQRPLRSIRRKRGPPP